MILYKFCVINTILLTLNIPPSLPLSVCVCVCVRGNFFLSVFLLLLFLPWIGGEGAGDFLLDCIYSFIQKIEN